MDQTPQSAKDVVAALTEAFPELPAALQAAARYIIDNPREVGVKSMRALAARAAVHPNAFVRLARRHGLSRRRRPPKTCSAPPSRHHPIADEEPERLGAAKEELLAVPVGRGELAAVPVMKVERHGRPPAER